MHSNDIETFLNSMRTKREMLALSETDLRYCDNKTQDLLHKLELETLTYHEKAKIAQELEEIRKVRRKAKNQIEQLTPIITFMNNNKKHVDQLNQLLGDVRKIEKRQSTRVYNTRVND